MKLRMFFTLVIIFKNTKGFLLTLFGSTLSEARVMYFSLSGRISEKAYVNL